MVVRVLTLCALTAAAMLSVAGCGDGTSGAAPPTAEQLASSLVTADDYDGEWTVDSGPDDSATPPSGVVPPELQDMLPRLELCEAAGARSRAAADGLRWKAFRQLDLTEEDPIAPPGDRKGHMVFVQQFLTSGEPAEIERTFDLLRDGMKACLGDIPAGEEGPGTAKAMAVPRVGDDRYGVLTIIQEAGGLAQWRLHNTVVRQGAVMMLIDVVDIRAGVAPLYSIDEVGTFVTRAVGKL